MFFDVFTASISPNPKKERTSTLVCKFLYLIFITHTIIILIFVMQSYDKALRIDSSYKPAAECLAIVLTDLGTSLKLAGNTQEGIQKYYEALKIDPHYAVISCFFLFPLSYAACLYFHYFSVFHTVLGSDALSLCMQPAYYNLGVVYSEMMQYDTALSCYEKAALERPMYAEAYCNMGVIFKNRGDLESAITCYER